MNVRFAEREDVARLAQLWYDGWQDAHAAILPAELARHRTRASLETRLLAAQPHLRVAGPPGEPVGFCLVEGDELNQLYVSSDGRGTGVAGALLDDAEAILRAKGVGTAWLACAIGNDRAARFYEKHGWRRVGTVGVTLEVPGGIFPLDVWRYEKVLNPAA